MTYANDEKIMFENFDRSRSTDYKHCSLHGLIIHDTIGLLDACYVHANLLTCMANKSSSGDEIPERDVTYLLSVYLFTTELRHTCTSGIFSE